MLFQSFFQGFKLQSMKIMLNKTVASTFFFVEKLPLNCVLKENFKYGLSGTIRADIDSVVITVCSRSAMPFLSANGLQNAATVCTICTITACTAEDNISSKRVTCFLSASLFSVT